MLDIELIRKAPEKVREALQKRNGDVSLLEQFQKIDDEWRSARKHIEDIYSQQKKAAKERDQELGKRLKGEAQTCEEHIKKLEEHRYGLLLEFPNIPFDDVPVGKDENENKVLRTWGHIPSFSFTPKDHIELGERLEIIDVKKAAEVSGSRFYYLKGMGALLEFALIQYAMRVLTQNGFVPVIPPTMIRPDVYQKMGRMTNSQKEERYRVEPDNLYLVGSAEHTMGPLHMDETIPEAAFPKRYVGFSSCFRRESGSYGKDVRGILRVHQFDKVEMFSFADPHTSEHEHQFLLSMQEKLFQGLEIPYEIISICTGDMGVTDARQYDINAWIPSQQMYREVGSCSNTTDYQTRGIKTKIKRVDGSEEYAHALNATGIALGRTLIALIENYQQEDGSIRIPTILQSYFPNEVHDIPVL